MTNKKHHCYTIAMGIALLISLVYREFCFTTIHEMWLYDPLLYNINGYISSPVYYLTLGALLTACVYHHTRRRLRTPWRIGCAIASISMMLFLYAFITVPYLHENHYFFAMYIRLHPMLYIILGIFLTLGMMRKTSDAPTEHKA